MIAGPFFVVAVVVVVVVVVVPFLPSFFKWSRSDLGFFLVASSMT